MNRRSRWCELIRHALQAAAFVGAALVLAAVVYSSAVVQNRRAQEASATATEVAEAKGTAAAEDAEGAYERPIVGVVGARDDMRLYSLSDLEGLFPGPPGAMFVRPGQDTTYELPGEADQPLRVYTAVWESDGTFIFTGTLPMRMFILNEGRWEAYGSVRAAIGVWDLAARCE